MSLPNIPLLNLGPVYTFFTSHIEGIENTPSRKNAVGGDQLVSLQDTERHFNFYSNVPFCQFWFEPSVLDAAAQCDPMLE